METNSIIMKLSPKQNSIIYCLQNGWELITSPDGPPTCTNEKHQFAFSWTIFYNLFYKKLIDQNNEWNFGYILTELGKTIKTRKIDLSEYI